MDGRLPNGWHGKWHNMPRHSDKMPEPKVRAERMTERMVKEYSLNDTQKQQLLEANLALVEKMGDMPMHRAKAHKHHKRDGKRIN